MQVDGAGLDRGLFGQFTWRRAGLLQLIDQLAVPAQPGPGKSGLAVFVGSTEIRAVIVQHLHDRSVVQFRVSGEYRGWDCSRVDGVVQGPYVSDPVTRDFGVPRL